MITKMQTEHQWILNMVSDEAASLYSESAPEVIAGYSSSATGSQHNFVHKCKFVH
jgi:hypothetical protein